MSNSQVRPSRWPRLAWGCMVAGESRRGLAGASAFCDRYFSELASIMARIDREAVGRLADALLDTSSRNASIFLIGNGGSAATASHWANDLASIPGRNFRALSLADNVATVTAIANDHGYEKIFARQLDSLLVREDMVVAFSASGNSPNILSAIELANGRGSMTAGLTGFDGGKLRHMVQIAVHIESEPGSYGPVEDLHMVMDHLVTSYLCEVINSR